MMGYVSEVEEQNNNWNQTGPAQESCLQILDCGLQ
jgi:hypothetical protein